MSIPRKYLGIETGATRTTVLLTDAAGEVLDRFELGPANVKLLGQAEIISLLNEIRERVGAPTAIAAGMAGLRNEDDRLRIIKLAREVWPDTPFLATSDLETALATVDAGPDQEAVRVLLLSGTGSCAYGRAGRARVCKFGGRGHILGDQGSACDIALNALRSIVYQHDLTQEFPPLGTAILRALQLNHPDDLIPWSQEAEKHEIAALAVTVFNEAAKEDSLALAVLSEAADKLADMGLRCADKLTLRGAPLQFILAGGTLLKQPQFARAVTERLLGQWAGCTVSNLKLEGAWGAVKLARELDSDLPGSSPLVPAGRSTTTAAHGHPGDGDTIPLSSLDTAPTEQRNPRTLHLDTMPLEEAIGLMVQENIQAIESLMDNVPDLVWMIQRTVAAFRAGGRLFYVGAGTSGRLGVLDASECPPTFRVPPDQVQGIMAGGRRAIWSAVEGAEDLTQSGADAIQYRGVNHNDIVLGIAASGRTPFVWGALGEAKRLGATTAMLAFHPGLEVDGKHRPDRLIRVNTGPEPLTGSTRLKAGTATKVFLNILTTMAMVQMGKVQSNLMIDLNPSNVKLRLRAEKLVMQITNCSRADARAALEKTAWVVKEAISTFKGSREADTKRPR